MRTNWKKMGVYLKVGRPSKHTLSVVDMVMRKKQEAMHEMATRINSDLLQGEIVYRIQLSDGSLFDHGKVFKTRRGAEGTIDILRADYNLDGKLKRYHLVPIIDPTPSQEP